MNYYEFVDKYSLLQRDVSNEGIGLAKTLLIKRLILINVGISENIRSWNVPLEVLQEILNSLERRK